MNEVMKALLERRSIRKFKPDALTKEQLGQIVEAGLYAASGKGAQSAIAVVVTNKALRDRLSAENCRIGGWEEGFDPFTARRRSFLFSRTRTSRTTSTTAA